MQSDRRFLILASLLTAASLCSAASTSSACTAKPVPVTHAVLKLLDHSPVVVRGLHFKPGERVRVTAFLDDSKRSRVLRASAWGAFTLSFGEGTRVDFCSGLLVVAFGARGSKAVLKLPPRECPPLGWNQ